MADRIIVMDAGQVEATGTHTDLVAASPLYAELAATQFLCHPDAPPPGAPEEAPAPDAQPPSAPAPEAPVTGLVSPRPR